MTTINSEYKALYKKDFDLLRKQIYRMCGLTISDNKEYLIQHRFKDLYNSRNCRSWHDFYQLLVSGDDQFKEDAVSAISTHETSFFRDSHPFTTVKNQILPAILKKRKFGGKIKIWCAASSTGQEPYSLSMLIHECSRTVMGSGISPDNFSILGTDISGAVIEQAQKGIYTNLEKTRGLPSEYEKYFQKQGNKWHICPSVKSLVSFKKFNLLNSFSPLGKFDFIMCRNVLIYFDETTKANIIKRIHSTLEDNSFLMLGSTETLGGNTDLFETKHTKGVLLYHKK
ncbi:protein-glutamate O-methyltransferase CheR [Maridesulfovibrio sp.]|uniref:CheR family methyltransferase n=1 Tax=Maridesulfovibrio sp. TaxID=2795000 RepID=UPI0029CA3004|nr:protein-glutamate O-methyltransferase CheR [Maridesulfovibrio sp.]